MMDVGRHPNIETLTYSEVIGLEGRQGNFRATVRKHPRYVIEDKCTGCGLCAKDCPVVAPNLFDMGLGARKAIYTPFPQAVPNTYTIDRDACLNDDFIVCGNCQRVCEVDAIDYDMAPEDVEIDVSSVVVATGFDTFDPYDMKLYGYGTSPNILTGMEFERMLNASGPTQGHVVKPSDMKIPEKIAFIQCVGVRGECDRQYCSRFCCMNTVKSAMLALSHHDEIKEIQIMFSDIRAFGKGYEEFYQRSKDYPQINYFRGRPAKITNESDEEDLIIHVENTATGRPERVNADMVVLASAAVPSPANQSLAEALGVELDAEGYFKVRFGEGNVLYSSRDGVLVAGCAKGPEDIPDCVAQASGAAAEAAGFIPGERLEEEPPEIEPIDVSGPPRIGVFICHCGANIAGVVDVEALETYAKTLPDAVFVTRDLFLCADSGQKQLQEVIKENKLNRVVAAACTPRTHEPVFRDTLARIGMNPFLFEMVNIRDQCSWVHTKEPEEATRRAMDQLRMGVVRARWLQPLETSSIDVIRSVVVIGGGITGIQTALKLAEQDIDTVLIEKSDTLGGRMRELYKLYPSNVEASAVLEKKLAELKESDVKVHTLTNVTKVSGFVGNFEVETTGKTFKAGAIVVAIGADLHQPGDEYGYDKLPNVMTNLELEDYLKNDFKNYPGGEKPKRVAFIQCVGSRDPETNPACSRYCCAASVKQSLALAEQGTESIVLYRDMRTQAHSMEEMYRDARGAGVIFFRYPDDVKPKVIGKKKAEKVQFHENLMGQDLEFDVDAVVLAVAMRPFEDETARFREMLKVPRTPDGFMMERHPKLGPVETTVSGIFLAGTIQGPKDSADAMAQASATASKAAEIVCREQIELDATTAHVHEEMCRACGKCVEICDFHAPGFVEIGPGLSVARINEALCKGCGTCAAWCPVQAIGAKHFTDQQIHAMLETMLTEGVA